MVKGGGQGKQNKTLFTHERTTASEERFFFFFKKNNIFTSFKVAPAALATSTVAQLNMLADSAQGG